MGIYDCVPPCLYVTLPSCVCCIVFFYVSFYLCLFHYLFLMGVFTVSFIWNVSVLLYLYESPSPTSQGSVILFTQWTSGLWHGGDTMTSKPRGFVCFYRLSVSTHVLKKTPDILQLIFFFFLHVPHNWYFTNG